MIIIIIIIINVIIIIIIVIELFLSFSPSIPFMKAFEHKKDRCLALGV